MTTMSPTWSSLRCAPPPLSSPFRGPAPAFATPDSLEDGLFAVEVDAVNQGHGVCDSQLVLRRRGTDEKMLVLLDSAAAAALHDGLNRSRGPRPGPHDVFASALGALGARVERVVICDLVGDLYHARACVAAGGGGGQGGGGGSEIGGEIGGASSSAGGCIDCRPSDGINLALRCGAPIFVSAEVWREAARIATRSPPDDGDGSEGGGGFQQQRGGSPSSSSPSPSFSSPAWGPAVAIHSSRFGAPPGHPALGRHGGASGGGDDNMSSSSSLSAQPPPLAAAAARARAALKRASSKAALAQLRARMAAAEGRFEDAARLRDAGQAALLGPFSLAPLAAALDAALADLRYEEAEALAERLAEEGEALAASVDEEDEEAV